MKLSLDYIYEHATQQGGWTRYQIESLGLVWKPSPGWQEKIVGKTITKKQQLEFERGSAITFKEYPKEKHHLPKSKSSVKEKSAAKEECERDCLKEAISLALWLVKDKDYNLKKGVAKASEKRGYKIKAHIERGVRKRLPEDFLADRSSAFQNSSTHMGKHMILESIAQKRHMKSIMEE